MPLEKAIKRHVVQYLNSLPRCYVRAIHSSPFSKGWADVMGTIAGRTLAIEIKQPGEKATTLQVAELAKWQQAGAVTGVVTTVDDVKGLLRAHGVVMP